MIDIFDVADWFLSKESMIHKKLQKLCYYAQAWYLVFNQQKPLFDGSFEAWAHGPVNRELWNELKDWGYTVIPQNELRGDKRAKLDANAITVLERVWDTYGEMTGFQLEDQTHEEEPWLEARGGLPYYAPSNSKISEKTMYRYYKSQYSGDGVGE